MVVLYNHESKHARGSFGDVHVAVESNVYMCFLFPLESISRQQMDQPACLLVEIWIPSLRRPWRYLHTSSENHNSSLLFCLHLFRCV